jgi:thiosulfate/3-mercaptopyruvate sulfurtransferase
MTNDKGYVHSEVLVSTDWVAQHLNDPKVRLVESNEDTLLYAQGHVPGAVQIDWTKDLNDQVRRDYISKEQFEALCEANGISNDTTIVFYGDKNNWWACYALWVFKLFGHEDCRVMDGGSLKWSADGRPTTREVPSYPKGSYKAQARTDYKIRAFRWWMCVAPANLAGNCCICPIIPKKGPCAVVTSQGPRASPGPRPSMKTGLLSRP